MMDKKKLTTAEINDFIGNNVLQSGVWDKADFNTQYKAFNNATRLLKQYLNAYYKDVIPLDHLAEQIVWMLKIDDSLQRAELGVTYIQVDGIAMNISQVDRTICPYVCKCFGLPQSFTSRRRVGQYGLSNKDTFRGGCTC